MEPINASERTTALLKYLGITVFVLVLVLFVFYFDTLVVPQQVTMLTRENELLRANSKQNTIAIRQMDSLNSKLMRYDLEPNKEIARKYLDNDVIQFYSNYQSDSSDFGKIMQRVAAAYKNAIFDKGKLADAGTSSAAKAEMEKKIIDLKKDLDDAKRDLKDANMQLLIYKKQP
jgi:hypothetical protein